MDEAKVLDIYLVQAKASGYANDIYTGDPYSNGQCSYYVTECSPGCHQTLINQTATCITAVLPSPPPRPDCP